MSSFASAMSPPSQIPLPLSPPELLARTDLIVCPGNAKAVAYVDSWPDWPVPIVALFGPSGCGKTHLASVWRGVASGKSISATHIADFNVAACCPLVIEDVDRAECSSARDAALFRILERAGATAPCLLTGRAHPANWPVVLPDLGSRFAAIPALPLWAPDETMLAAVARKLFSDRQLHVPDAVIEEMLIGIERSPGAIREFVTELDAAALAAARPVSLTLVRRLIAARSNAPCPIRTLSPRSS